MEDFVIVIVKKFSYAQNYYNWNDMEVLCFLVFGFWFFPPFTCTIVTQIV